MQDNVVGPKHSSVGNPEEVLYSSAVLDPSLVSQWLPRCTQINVVELFAAVAALDSLAPRLRGKLVIVCMDNVAVEGALIKGTVPARISASGRPYVGRSL